MRTGTWRTRGCAWGIVLAWHALVGWWLLHALPRVSTRSDGDDALQVVYVSLPPPAPSTRTRAVAPSRRSHHADRPRKSRRQAAAVAVAAAPGLQVVAATRPASAADLFAQARALARRQAAATAPGVDVFADRPARLPQADAGRFRMREPLSVARVVEAVSAELFYPPGYEADPCPRNRRNIAGLLAAGDSPRLQLELEFERRHCRP